MTKYAITFVFAMALWIGIWSAATGIIMLIGIVAGAGSLPFWSLLGVVAFSSVIVDALRGIVKWAGEQLNE